VKKINKTPLAAAMGAAFISTLSASPASAEANPFGMTELSSGYMQVAAAEMACGASMNMKDPKAPEGACAGKPTKAADKPTSKSTEGSCGEGKCGAMMQDGKMKPGLEQSCGAMMKGKEGACGAGTTDSKPAEKPAAKATEGACGEGMCGAMMQGDKMKPGLEHNCGAMMKGKDGACGAAATEPKTAEKPTAKTAEGACGEGMCGAMMQGGKMKPGLEQSCGAMMKGKEGACGAMDSAVKKDTQTTISPDAAAGHDAHHPDADKKSDEQHDKYGLDKSLIKVIPYVPKK